MKTPSLHDQFPALSAEDMSAEEKTARCLQQMAVALMPLLDQALSVKHAIGPEAGTEGN